MNAQPQSNALDALFFDNRFVQELPSDPEMDNHCRQVMSSCYSRVSPTKVAHPQLVAYALEVAQQLGLERNTCESDDFTQTFGAIVCWPVWNPTRPVTVATNLVTGRGSWVMAVRLIWVKLLIVRGSVGLTTKRCWPDSLFANG